MSAHPNRALTRAAAMLAATALAGCVVPPATIVPQQIPYVAVPGPTKTEAQFHQDDLTCRAAAAQLPPGPGVTQPVRSSSTTTAVPSVPAPLLEEPPGVTYFRCMALRNNQIQPLPQAAPPALYAYYQPYPVYVGGYGDYYPWLYGPGFFGLYGGYGFGFGFGYGRGFYGRGFYDRGFYGRGFYGGYRGGYEGGFRGGYGGGFHGGGFHR